jgi:hypothetical protein
MIKEFEKLNDEEREFLYRAPVLISVLVSSSPNEINETRKNDAIKLSHLRTFTAPPSLHEYYRQVEKIFKEEFESLAAKYFPFHEEQRAEIKKELMKFEVVASKLDPSFAFTLNKSLESYARHVQRSVYTVFRSFIFPIAFSRLNDL